MQQKNRDSFFPLFERSTKMNELKDTSDHTQMAVGLWLMPDLLLLRLSKWSSFGVPKVVFDQNSYHL